MPLLRSLFFMILGAIAVLAPFVLVHQSGVALGRMFEGELRATAPTAVEITLLAQDVHVVVGGVPLVFPLVALEDLSRRHAFFSDNGADWLAEEAAARAAFAISAAGAANAPHFDKVRVHIERFGWEDEHGARWKTICAQLRRAWSISVCDAAAPPLLQSLPRGDFILADARKLPAFRDTYLSIGDLGEAAPILQAMDLTTGDPALACGNPHKPDAPRPCLAALRIAGDLVAVWFVRDGPDESALTQARREGRAIAALVAHGLGPVEDFKSLTAAACATLRPGSGPFRPDDASWPC